MNDAMPQGDVQPRQFAEPFCERKFIRRATLADMPFMIALAREKYPDMPVERGIGWMEGCIGNPERLVLVGPNSVGVAQIGWNYGFERRARLAMLGARHRAASAWEAFKMVQIMVAWAKDQGAEGTFKLDADTGVDFGPFARRLGGKSVTVTRYELPL